VGAALRFETPATNSQQSVQALQINGTKPKDGLKVHGALAFAWVFAVL
jgi:hypothetical protein